MSSLSSLHLGHGLSNTPIDTNLLRRDYFRTIPFKFTTTLPKNSVSSNSNLLISNCSLTSIAPLEAILFDIDGTLCDSDPLHFIAFRKMLQEVGFNGGSPITEDFFIKIISGKHNDEIARILFPDWNLERSSQFMVDKEAEFRRLASEQMEPVKGIYKLRKWIEDRGLKRAAVTNAPRSNAELLISSLGLSDFFEVIVTSFECERAKPFPDPYLKGLKAIKASHKHTLVFEDSVSGIKAGVAAGMSVVGISLRNPKDLLMKAGAKFLINNFEDQKLWRALEDLDREKAGTQV
ncbi:hypothetical protein GIB67_038691 [Kingdonia uniflora]|uniref:Haloacid dehalogenase-like hydrolase domain-containing protein Sgpp n=1 Tax=Kingdonia uniflora TaxID=39325 RepID=A0A7J7NTB0_9MAGN|nr:hypothetical protein GIB67_038691 [Kingdonia uniflora]